MLVGSSLQKQFLPIDGQGSEYTLEISKIDSKAILDISVSAIGMLAKYLAMERLGAIRLICLLIPVESLIRANRGGFINVNTNASIAFVSAIVLGIVFDFLAICKIEVVTGYVWLSVSVICSVISISRPTQVDTQFYGGLLLSCIGVLSWSIFGMPLQNTALLEAISILAGVAALTWVPTQPRAISTALKLVWPLVLTCSAFLSINFIHDLTPTSAVPLVVYYFAVFANIRSSATANSAQSAANVIPSDATFYKYGGYYINEVLKEKESRDIFYFMCLNLAFMVVQMLYGIWTNSLGLISDSIHMLFDCLALAVGLVAAVMSKWPASRAHPFGFAKVEIISGFANSIFLVLISISILIEAVERLMEPPEMTTDQLLLISTLGLAVNLVGIFAFNHGHHHGHHHSHGPKEAAPEPLPTIHTPRSGRSQSGDFDHLMGMSPRPDSNGFALDSARRSSVISLGTDALGVISENTKVSRARSVSPSRARSPIRRPGSPLKLALEPSLGDVSEEERLETPKKHSPEHEHEHEHHEHHHKHEHKHAHSHNHSCGHSHDHSHNMEGIFLHILADTLGSAGVIVSTILIRMFGWTGFDPLASIFIAVLIFLSVVPLLKSSFKDLLLTLQDDQEYTVKEVLADVSLIQGVNEIPFIRFWTDGQGSMHGILTIRAGINGDLDVVRSKVRRRLLDGVPDLKDVIVQVDRGNEDGL